MQVHNVWECSVDPENHIVLLDAVHPVRFPACWIEREYGITLLT